MLHPLAQDGVLRISRNFDRDTLADFLVLFHDRIAELNAVASRTRRRPCSQDDIDRLDAPLVVGRVVLRRPSAGAMEWLRTFAAQWWGKSSRAYAFALAWACSSRDQAAFDLARSRIRASVTAWKWALRSGASEESLRRAALALMPPPDDSLRWFSDPDEQAQNARAAPDLGAIALSLSKTFGGTPEHWIWEVADDDFWKAVCDSHDDEEIKHAKQMAGVGQFNPDGTWWMRHRKALRDCEVAFESDVAAWLESRKPKEASNG